MAVAAHPVRWLLLGALGGAGGGSTLAYLQHNKWQLQSTGLFRFGRAACTIAVVVVDYKKSLRKLTGEEPHYQQLISQVHRRSAERLRDMCSVNGGCFVKVGQHIGSLDYLVPAEYVETMRVFHDNAPQSHVTDMYSVLKEDLGADVNELFAEFDEHPVGAASLAQVHRAVLKDGSEVAVKIQHPQVKAHSFIDMKTMELFVRMVALLFPEFRFLWLAEEMKKNLPLELDFVHEGHNCERVARMFSHFSFLKVPKVYWKYSSKRVLTMEFCDGGRVNDTAYIKKNNISVNEISCNLGKLYSEMIFVQGYVHCDPHPGNVLVKKMPNGTQLVLLDHGLYSTLTDDFRLNYSQLWLAMISADLKGIQHWSTRLGVGQLYGLLACMVSARSWDAITKGIDKHAFTEEENEEIRNNAANFLPQITAILDRVPREMLLIFKTNDLLRGIESTLQTRANATALITMSRNCIRAVYAHRMKLSRGRWNTLALLVERQFALLRLSAYEFYLWAISTSLVQKVRRVLKKDQKLKLTLS